MYEGITDEELVHRIKADDERAYRELFHRHFKHTCHCGFKVFPDHHKAKDFAQEVFLDIWKRRETLNIKMSVKAYLSRAVKYKSIDFIRAQKINFEEEGGMKNEKYTNHNQTEFKELKDVIHNAVNQLPQKCKVVFSMSRFEQMSHGEIAEELGISKKTIENQITKALKILRQSVLQYQLD